jgi:hypothetical protein
MHSIRIALPTSCIRSSDVGYPFVEGPMVATSCHVSTDLLWRSTNRTSYLGFQPVRFRFRKAVPRLLRINRRIGRWCSLRPMVRPAFMNEFTEGLEPFCVFMSAHRRKTIGTGYERWMVPRVFASRGAPHP